tara:strand:+ start:1902 stop:2144 length:243 start_codon:yes stop_codon:yes gene_type:complete
VKLMRKPCDKCGGGMVYDQPQMDGESEMKCFICGYNAEPPAEPKVNHREGGTRYEPRFKGQGLKASTVERNKYGGGKRPR